MTQPHRAPSALAVVPRRAARPPLRRVLLRGVSVSALVVAAAAPVQAAPYRSLGQAVSAASSAAVRAAATGGGSVAARQAGLGAQNLATAAARFQSLAQALANQAYTGPAVADGVQPGGLQQAAGVAGSANSTLWSGASTTLNQSVSNGITSVTVNQTQSTAALTWQTFNVGAHTHLNFNQGATSWIVINKVEDPAANGSTILGEISAPGKVYVLNRNGILFGAGSVVDVGSLVAATADIAQAQFTTSTNGLISGFTLYGGVDSTGKLYLPTFIDSSAGASITVQRGAVIETPYPTGTNAGGYVMLLGGTVQNQGSISTPEGQTVLAAGNQFVLQPGSSTSNITATVIGSAVDAQTTATITGTGTTALGAVTNTGIVVADQGDITMDGHLVTQAGILLSSTTVNTRGTVHLLTDSNDTTGEVVLAPNSVTEVLPLELYSVNGTLQTTLQNPNAPQQGTLITGLDAQRLSAISNSATANAARDTAIGPQLLDANTLADQQNESRIEISTGGTVDMQGSALALAQGGQFAVAAPNIVLESGATVDVSGVNAQLSAAANSLYISGIVPYYLRDSAANRTGGLEFANVYIDERTLVEITTGSYATGCPSQCPIYTQGGLLEVSGNLGLVGHGIDEWSALAGQVTLQAVTNNGGVPAGGTVTIAQGAVINLTGGTVSYAAGEVQQSYVVSTDGRIFNINNAPGDLVYSGVYTGTVEAHPRWHISQTFVNPLLTPSEVMQSAYTIGRDAGSLTVGAGTAVLDGTVDAGVTVGSAQNTARGTSITDPFTLAQSVAPLAGSLELGTYETGQLLTDLLGSTISITGSSTGGGSTPVLTALPDAVTGTISVAGDQLSADGFANITAWTAAGITLDTALSVADGGTVTLGGNSVDIGASITAHGGAITLATLLPGSTISLGTGFGSITLSNGATLNTSGDFANARLDPFAQTHGAFINGGTVTITSTGGVDLQNGSAIDVTGGGLLSSASKLTAGNGGSVLISGDIAPTASASYDPYGTITIDSTIKGYAAGSAGTLSVTVPNIIFGTLTSAGYPPDFFVISPNGILTPSATQLFASGFANYTLNGFAGLQVQAGQDLDVTRPVYVLDNAASGLATGTATGTAFDVFMPTLYTVAKGNDSFTQRAGASLVLEASIYPSLYNGGGGPLLIGAGAQIAVDPKQSITVAGYGQVTDLGTLTAHGGTVTVANTRFEQINSVTNGTNPANYATGLSVWIGDGAVVDVSGVATIFTDARGRTFGAAQSGGTILLGGLGGLSAADQQSTYAQVIVQSGAVLNADGASATVDVGQGLGNNVLTVFGTPQTLAGNGGTIGARSLDGVALDGTMTASGAGPGATGGTLQMRIDPQNLDSVIDVPADLYAPSIILVSQDTVPVQTDPNLTPGAPTDPTTIGIGRISQQQIDAGGFTTLNLYAQDDIEFDGNVNLHLAGALYLQSGILGETQTNATVSVTAPYVALTGIDLNANRVIDYNPYNPTLNPSATSSTLLINADMIDVQNLVDLGGTRKVGTPAATTGTIGTSVFATADGFASADFVSSGDIRFDIGSTGGSTALASSGNITLTAAQLYPASGANASVFAGDNPDAAAGINRFAGGTLTILGSGTVPAAPYSVGGSLTLVADNVVQDGVVRAPEGVIQLGIPSNAFDPNTGSTIDAVTDNVTLGAGSVTSVSLYGQTIPYGGTVDGVNYLYNNAAVGTFTPLVEVYTAGFTATAGADIDLRGGGTLAGAGFIPGRGGSADVNKTPLLNSSSGTVTANTTDQVYAILPGYSSGYAPVAPGDSGYNTPSVGEQINIGANEVAGLAAGTYSLLPAYYDLLPGAYRVELTGAVVQPGSATYFGNFTTAAAVRVGTAGTGFLASVPTAALITSGTDVRQLSQYDEETYNQFEVTAAATFGSPRPFLPQDAKTLQFTLTAPSGGVTADDQPLSIASGVIQSAPAAFSTGTGTETQAGYGATVVVTSDQPLEVLAPGGTPGSVLSSDGTTVLPALGIAATTLAALTQPVAVQYTNASGALVTEESGTRLVLGGTITITAQTPNLVLINGQAPDVTVDTGATLTAADILLTSASGGTIDVSAGATLSTLGEGAAPFGAAQGFYFNSDFGAQSSPVLAVSNSDIIFTPNQQQSSGSAIIVGNGALLQGGSAGSLDFVAPGGSNVQVGEAMLAAANVDVQVANINIGSTADLTTYAADLPGGLSLTAATLQTLAQQATVLTLTAQQAVNILGNVTLNSGTTDLVLNTPALYGYNVDGAAANGVTIQAPNFTWGGVSAVGTLSGVGTFPQTVTATPGGRLTGLDNNATGAYTLNLDATGTVTLGYGPDTQVNDQVQLDRLALGFTSVTLAAGSEITANNESSLSVYDTQATFGQPGSGGDLTLSAPLITADSGTVLKLTAGGALTANAGTSSTTSTATSNGTTIVTTTVTPLAAAATGTVATLGAQIDLTANTVETGTSIALPAGKLTITAQNGIDLGSTSETGQTITQTITSAGTTTSTQAGTTLVSSTTIDLAGRGTGIFDQTANSNGGTLLLETYAGGTGNITEDAGATINVSSPGAEAGSISATAQGGSVAFNGSLLGTGATLGGSFTVFADSFATTGTQTGFDALNTTLDAGGFTALRDFELATGNITVDQTIAAQRVGIDADAGSIDVAGTINASGATVGSISLAAGQNLTLEATSLLDAHATTTVVDSYGEDIDAENRAHVSLTSTAGTVTLDPGATINVTYPDAAANPQGQVVINAPRTSNNGTVNSVAVSAPGAVSIIGAQAINLYAFTSYTPTDANGTIVQDNGTGTTPGTYQVVSSTGTVGLVQIDADNQAYMTALGANAAGLEAQLAGLVAYKATFNLAPGVSIVSSAASGGDLTVSGDLDFSALRYSDPSAFGIAVTSSGGTTVTGSGEPGSIAFRASNNLAINGSISDGFEAPPDETSNTVIAADASGWQIHTGSFGAYDPTNADILLPSSAFATVGRGSKLMTSSQLVLLGAQTINGVPGLATEFDTDRPISLNYNIVINPANLNTGVVIPFAVTVGTASSPVPAGGWVATAAVMRNGAVLYAKGALIPAGFVFQPNDVLAAGSVLPVNIQTGDTVLANGTTLAGQLVPAGTSLNVFADSQIVLAQNTDALPANALIPSNTLMVFGAIFSGETAATATQVTTVDLRPTNAAGAEGYLTPIAAMLPAGSLSWSMDFTAGANLAAADASAVQPRTTLADTAFVTAPTAINQAPGSLLIDDQHYYSYTASNASNGDYAAAVTAFSVIRTGTGDLTLVAGGDVDQSSLYGIYTAGTQDPLASSAENAAFNAARETLGAYDSAAGTYALLPGTKVTGPELSGLVSSSYEANYPNDGGDVLVAAGGDLTSDVLGLGGSSSGTAPSDAVGDWLWRQGSSALGQQTSWWINFGTLVAPLGEGGGYSTANGEKVQLTGFTGIGALGGGNVVVTVRGDAGQITARDEAGLGGAGAGPQIFRGEGLVIAVGGTGRLVTGSTTPVTTGGGDITLTVGGTLNPLDAAAYGTGATVNGATGESTAVNGDLIDLRGNIDVTAGAIGRVDYVFNSGTNNIYDPRTTDPFTPNDGVPNGGIAVVPGDGAVDITTDRDLVLGGAGDPGREAAQGLTTDADAGATNVGIFTGFTLWQPTTSITLFSDGGNVTPSTLANQVFTAGVVSNTYATDFRSEYPATLLVTAATGSIIYGQDGTTPGDYPSTSSESGKENVDFSLETMPSPDGQVAFLAGKSIYANGYAVDISGASPAGLSLPTDPAYQTTNTETPLTNVITDAGTNQSALALFALEADTPTGTTPLHADDTNPARFYAATGDIVDFRTGETLNFVDGGTDLATWYIAAKPVWILAGNDIVSPGNRPIDYPGATLFGLQENQFVVNIVGSTNEYSSGNLILNDSASDVSIVSAGRDILSAYTYIAGPGLLDVQAGRNLYQAAYSLGATQELFFGSFKSLGDGALTGGASSLDGGASIVVQAGIGSDTQGYANFASLYFNPADQFSFDGTFPNASIPSGSDTYSFGGKVQFDYATAIPYSYIATVLAADAKGQSSSLLYKPAGAPAAVAGITFPTGLAALLQTIQQGANPLPTPTGASDPYNSFSGLQLLLWQYANYRGTAANAPAFFAAQSSQIQDLVVRMAFYFELQASGADHANASSTFYDSYRRGFQAIDTLFPSSTPETSPGIPAGYTGAITMYSGTVGGIYTTDSDTTQAVFDGGIATLFGGSVQVLDPGGAVEFGIPGGPAPGNSSGIVTYGAGDVDIWSLGSVLLGKSRIFTTAGGNIVIWSSEGDINAGIGAKTTISYNPPVLVYDDVGDVSETPPASTSGAGIATLQPLPSVPAGDVNLIAPFGTIDAGEAGIRVSGNLVLAAARVSGTANIAVKGSTAGAPTVSVASLGAVEAAGAAAGAASSAAQSQAQRNTDTREVASVVDVDVLTIGGTYDEERKRRRRGQQ